MKNVRIEIIGCDDSTILDIELTDEEIKFLDKLHTLSNQESSYSCMPVIDYYINE